MKKNIIKFVLSTFVFISVISFASTVSALTASDITMLLNAGIITQTQANSLNSSISNSNTPTDTAPSNVSTCVNLQNNMYYGLQDASVNGEVSVLQDFLQSNNYLSNNPTGFYGLITTNAVKAFQSANSISPTGIVGPITRAEIASLTCGSSVVSPIPVNPSNELQLTSNDNGKTINVSNGQIIVITLRNPGDGGYQFDTPNYDSSILKLISHTHNTPASTTPIIVGNFGTDVFKFQALNSGTSQIKITASRSWESGSGISIFSSTFVVGNIPVVTTAPIITSISPASGPVGTIVTIYGSNFSSLDKQLGTVSLNNHLASYGIGSRGYTLNNDNVLTFTVPAILAGTYDLQLVNLVNLGGNSNNVSFTVLPSSVVVTPVSGNLSVSSVLPGYSTISTIIAGQTAVDLAHFEFFNGSANQVTIVGLTLQVPANVALSNVYLFDNNGAQIVLAGRGNSIVSPSGQTITFNNAETGLFTVGPNTDITISIKGDVTKNSTGQFAVSLTGAAASIPIIAAYPISGTTISLSNPQILAPIINSINPTFGSNRTTVTLNGSFSMLKDNPFSIGLCEKPGLTNCNYSAAQIISTDSSSITVSIENSYEYPLLPETYDLIVAFQDGSLKSNAVNYTFIPATTSSIISITPQSGGARTAITIFGKNMNNASFVNFYDNSGKLIWILTPFFSDINNTEVNISPLFAENITPGTYNVKVVTPLGTTNSLPFTLLASQIVTQAPVITSVSPTSGSVGTMVTVDGSNFTSGMIMNIINDDIYGNGYVNANFVNNNEVTFTVPNIPVGTYALSLNSAGSISTSNTMNFNITTSTNSPHACPMFTPPAPNFCSGGTIVPRGTINGCPQPPTCLPAIVAAPIITSISPTSGSSGGVVTINGSNGSSGTVVTINGSNFSGNGDKGISVNLLNINDPYGTNYSSPVTLINSSILNFTVPNGVPSGTYNVSVSADGGQSNTVMFTIATSTAMAAPENSNMATVLNALSIKDLIMLIKVLTGQK